MTTKKGWPKRLWAWLKDFWTRLAEDNPSSLLAAAFTGLILFVTIAYATISFLQLRQIRRQGATAERQVYALRDQIGYANNGMAFSQTPWVSLIESPKITSPLRFDRDGTPHVTVTFTVRNEGLSPAFNFVVRVSLITEKPPLEDWKNRGETGVFPECKAELLLKDGLDHGTIILPHSTTTKEIEIKGRERESFKSSGEIYLVGCIGYTDQVPTAYNTKPGAEPTQRAVSIIEHYVRDSGRFESIGWSPYR